MLVTDRRESQKTELYRRTDEVLHYLWDPCHAATSPQARNEYNSYLPSVYNLLTQGADATKISSYLTEIESKRMGSSGSADRNQEVGEVLVEWRNYLAKHP